jgi:hypothetical protein
MKPETRMRTVSMAAAMAMTVDSLFGGGGSRIVAKNTRERSKGWMPHQGAQEIARRRRQIDKGQLTTSNGLVARIAQESGPSG